MGGSEPDGPSIPPPIDDSVPNLDMDPDLAEIFSDRPGSSTRAPKGALAEGLFDESDEDLPHGERSTDQRMTCLSDTESSKSEGEEENPQSVTALEEERPKTVLERRIPRKIRRRDDEDDDLSLVSPVKNRRITHTVATMDPPKPLGFGGNGDKSIPVERIRHFFDQLATWRQDTNNQGKIGDRKRNDFLIDGSLHGWLFTNSSDPELNPLDKQWEEFTDSELQDAITRWNGETTTGSLSITTTIDGFFTIRLMDFMEVHPERGPYLLSAL